MPIKKGKFATATKRKEAMSPPEAKKKGSKPKVTSSKVASKGATLVVAPERELQPIPVMF